MVRERGLGLPRTARAKVSPPRLGSGAIDRVRLLDALDVGLAGADDQFMMVTAPAGYGKTYLLAQWASRVVDFGTCAAWLTASADDRDPAIFWQSMLDAFAQASHDTELRIALEMLAPSMEPRAHARFLAETLDLISRSPERFAVIVDNADILEGSPAESEFIRFLQWAPTNVVVVAAARAGLHAHQERLRGRLVDLTADSLSFTRSETAEVLAARGLDDDQLAALFAETDGWPAALTLALLDIERRPDRLGPISGWEDPAELHHYLQSEVWSDLGSQEQEVLLAASSTGLTTASLIDTVRERTGSAAVLRELAGRSRLITQSHLDGEGRAWYRVQPLLQDFLRDKLIENGEWNSVLGAAASWHADSGDALTAVDLAVAIGCPVLVEKVLRLRGYEVVLGGRGGELLTKAVADQPIFSGPFAQLFLASAAVSCAMLDRARSFLAAPRVDELDADSLLEWDWLHYLVQLQMSLADGETSTTRSSGWPEDTLALVPEPLGRAVLLTRGLTTVWRGDTQNGVEFLLAARAGADNVADGPSMMLSTLGLAGAAAAEGNVRDARALALDASRLGEQLVAVDLAGPRALAHLLASWASLEMLDSTEAIAHADLAILLADQTSDGALQRQARQLGEQLSFESLSDKRHVTHEFVTSWPPPHLRSAPLATVVYSLHSGMRMAATLGEHHWNERLLDRARQEIGEGFDWQASYLMHLLQSRSDLARGVLDALLADTTSRRVPTSDILVWSAASVLEARANNLYRAHAAIYRALERAEQTGAYFEVARSGMPDVGRVLSDGLGRFGANDGTARRLLAEFFEEPVSAAEALTAREQQILGELRSLRTVEEIARDLLLSVNTVKTHMRGVYRKLDVSSRRQAVSKAEQAGML